MHSIPRVKQKRTVANFRKKFKIYSESLSSMSKDVLENTFLNGLDPTIGAKVAIHKPVGLREIMKHAQLIEDCDLAIKMAIDLMGSEGITENDKMAQQGSSKTSESSQSKLVNRVSEP